MKRAYFAFIALMLMLSVSAFAQVAAVPNTMQFQARLTKSDSTPVADGTYSVCFSLWTALTGGTEKWNQTSNVITKAGNFAILLSGFPAGTFDGSLFLEMKIGTDAPLTPRQPLASVVYAFKADKVKDNSITSASIVNGSITASDLAEGTLNPFAWLLGGNANPLVDSFLGTTTNHPLTMKVNNRRAMQITYVEDLSSTNPDFQHRTINVLGGAEINSISAGVLGATLVGGGDDYLGNPNFDNPNMVTNNFGTVVGGSLNRADGFSFVGGGYNNKATEFYSTIVGGTFNTASDNQTFIGGGISNTASGFGATVSGGSHNSAAGFASTVPGGLTNSAAGDYSFAAGQRAKALHEGSFVWADGQAADFASTSGNQFLIRAGGGVGINTTAPAAQLEINGGDAIALLVRNTNGFLWAIRIHNDAQPTFQTGMYVTNDGFFRITNRTSGSAFAQLNVNGTWTASSDRRLKTDIKPLSGLLSKVFSFRPVSYYFIKQDRVQSPHPQMGFIVQEVEELFLVLVEGEDLKTLNYAGLSVVAIGALQEQQKLMEALQKDNDAKLKQKDAEIAELRARLDALTEVVRNLTNDRK